jgi:hypothetical protein
MRPMLSLFALAALAAPVAFAGDEKAPLPRADMEQAIADVYAAADTDGTKGLSPTETDAALKALHEKMKAAHAAKDEKKEEKKKDDKKEEKKKEGKDGDKAGDRAKEFTAADANHDGVLSLDEFKELVHNLGGRRPPHDKKDK